MPLGTARRLQGEFRALIAQLGFPDQQRAELEARTDEAVLTSEIEGEPVSRIAIRSSIARRLNLEHAAVADADAREEGLVDMTLDATTRYAEPLTLERLHRWHIGLFPLAAGVRPRIAIGHWRDDASGPMQVVSGRIDAPTVHFEAPFAERIPSDMDAFLRWFHAPPKLDGLLLSAIAHLWFVTIHPYDDGNGRIGRAIADMALARDEQSSHRYFSMSRQINAEKGAYHRALERAQRSQLDITEWLIWFLECYGRSIEAARESAGDALKAQRFWRLHDDVALSDRQRRVLARYVSGFEGTLTTKKWSALAKISADTAHRDITDLVEKRVLVRNAGGSKNTSYSLLGYDD